MSDLDARTFAQHFFPPGEDLVLELRGVNKALSPQTKTQLLAPGDEPRVDAERNWWITVCAHTRPARGSTTKSTAAAAMAVWADLDHMTPEEAERRRLLVGLPTPSITVNSGNGVHFYWLLKEPARFPDKDSKKAFEARLKRVARILGGDTQVADVARIMRVPGTFNVKEPENPKLCLIVSTSRHRYALDDLDRALEPLALLKLRWRDADGHHCLALGLAGWWRRQGKERGLVEGLFRDLSAPDPIDDDAMKTIDYTYDQDRLPEGDVAFRPHFEAAFPNEPWLMDYLTGELGEAKKRVAAAPALTSPDGEFLCTDLRNAERLVARHGNALRYCHDWKQWLVWDEQRWARDNVAEVRRRAKETARAIALEANGMPDKQGKALKSWAESSESRERLAAMIDLATAEPGVPVRPDDLDADPWLLNVENGVLDLRTGVLQPHDPARLQTMLAPVVFDPNAGSPLWHAFLERFLPDEDLRRYIQKAAGYALTGVIREHNLFINYGGGANGKSTFAKTMLALLGDYGRQAEPNLLLLSKGEAHPANVADLRGRRFVVTVEVDEGRRLAESLVKQLTGGDRLNARRLYENFEEFEPTHKIWVGTNHRPVIRGTDKGIWRRVKLLPWEVSLSEAEQDLGFADRLRAELPGILNWALDGCLAWQREGLTAPDKVLRATAAYREEMDLIGPFLRERCVEEEGAQEQASVLYAVYVDWCNAHREKPITLSRFGGLLNDRGVGKDTDSKNCVVRLGVRLRGPGEAAKQIVRVTVGGPVGASTEAEDGDPDT